MWKSFLTLFHKNLLSHVIEHDFPLLLCYLSNKIKQISFPELLQF